MTEKIETTILRNLLHSEEFYRKVVPFLKAEYFEDVAEKIVYEEIDDFSGKYDKMPTSSNPTTTESKTLLKRLSECQEKIKHSDEYADRAHRPMRVVPRQS